MVLELFVTITGFAALLLLRANKPSMNHPDTTIIESNVESDQHAESCASADEIVLRLGSNDKLAILWGGVVAQKAGVPANDFGKNANHWILLVNKGILRLKIGAETFDISEGQTLIVLPGEICLRAEENMTAVQWQWLTFKVLPARRRSNAVFVEAPRICTPSDSPRIAELFRMLVEELHAHKALHPQSRLTTKGAQLLLLSLLSRLDPSETEIPLASNMATVLAERAKDYIRTNITRPISTSEVAKALECSDGYLGVAFRKTYGESPVNYILNVRVYVARELLAETRKSVGQIAQECGFTSMNYFARVFKRYHGISPTAYRMAHSHLYITSDI